jgi:hypothetical protein
LAGHRSKLSRILAPFVGRYADWETILPD